MRKDHDLALCEASEKGQLREVRKLLAPRMLWRDLKPKARVDARDARGRTPLILAARNGHLEVVEYLVAQGADVNAAADYGQTPLEVAAAYGHLEIVKLLVAEGSDVEATLESGETPLHGASNSEIARVLITKGAAVNAVSHEGKTPLMSTANAGDSEQVRVLLDAGADVNVRDNRGRTVLMSAAPWSTESFQLLIDRGADVNAADDDGVTPLISACVSPLQDAGGLDGYFYTEDDTGRYYEIWCRKVTVHEGINDDNDNELSALQTVRLLVDKGAEINAADNEGWTPLMAALAGGYKAIAYYLLENGADANSATKSGITPLMLACGLHVERQREVEQDDGTIRDIYSDAGDAMVIVELLIRRGADVNGTTCEGQTPLMAAVGNPRITSLLLAAGADVNAVDKRGWTALAIAEEETFREGALEAIELLRTGIPGVSAAGKLDRAEAVHELARDRGEPGDSRAANSGIEVFEVRCPSCGAIYRLGEDATVTTMRQVLDSAIAAIGLQSTSAGSKESPDLIGRPVATRDLATQLSEARRESQMIIAEIRSGQSRFWWCERCQNSDDPHLYTYPCD